MHKISDEFEFRSDRTTDYGVSCPWVSKKFPIDLQWENGVCTLAHSFLIKLSSKLLVTRTGIKFRMSLISGLWFPWPIYMFLKWDLTLAHWTQVSDRCPLGYLFFSSRQISAHPIQNFWANRSTPEVQQHCLSTWTIQLPSWLHTVTGLLFSLGYCSTKWNDNMK